MILNGVTSIIHQFQTEKMIIQLTTLQNQVLAINKDSKMADKAFQLIEYITTGEYDKKMTEDALCIPTDKANSDAWPTELSGVKKHSMQQQLSMTGQQV